MRPKVQNQAVHFCRELADVLIMQTRADDTYLSLEVLGMGGLSILFALAFWLFVDREASVLTISQAAFALAFICNHPHFLSSYVLLYGDYRKRLMRDKAYFWAGVLMPLTLFLGLGYALFSLNQFIMGQVVTLMYFLVGWHYVKQIFGCVIVSSVQRKIFYSALERRWLMWSLMSAWSMSFLASNIGPADFDFYGIPHHSLNLPEWCRTLSYVAVGITLTVVIGLHFKRYLESGVRPAPPAVVAFLALYVWYLPVMSHPAFGYLIPFFHSLQYLGFVGALKRNQVKSEMRDLPQRAARVVWLKRFLGFALTSTILGALCFEFVPDLLDFAHILPANQMGEAPFMASFILFINIHHYFIDNVIWRSSNPTVRHFLMETGTELNPVASIRAA